MSKKTFDTPKLSDLPPEVAVGAAEVPALRMPRPKETPPPEAPPEPEKVPVGSSETQLLRDQYTHFCKRFGPRDNMVGMLRTYAHRFHGVHVIDPAEDELEVPPPNTKKVDN